MTWLLWSVWSIWFVWFNQRIETDQIDPLSFHLSYPLLTQNLELRTSSPVLPIPLVSRFFSSMALASFTR